VTSDSQNAASELEMMKRTFIADLASRVLAALHSERVPGQKAKQRRSTPPSDL
jgi:hypothetical protein